jgi:hypothetical protein
MAFAHMIMNSVGFPPLDVLQCVMYGTGSPMYCFLLCCNVVILNVLVEVKFKIISLF